MIARLICRLFGHKPTAVINGDWKGDPRMLICDRCNADLGLIVQTVEPGAAYRPPAQNPTRYTHAPYGLGEDD